MREPIGPTNLSAATRNPSNFGKNQLLPSQGKKSTQSTAAGGTLLPPALSQGGNPSAPSVAQLQEMARRQQHQIEAQQQLLVAKEQRLKYLRQQDYRHHQMAMEYERLRRLREKVESQELKLRKLRTLRGQPNSNQQQNRVNSSVTADLESIRALFNEKEKELSLAVQKVDELTHQLQDLRSGRTIGTQNAARYPPQMVELERLRREVAYRRQLNEQQNNMIAQQRAQLGMGKEEMTKIDDRIVELQDRLARKRLMNQQLASQISAATNAKQAQLRAMQQGMMNKNKNKPVSTVEPFQRNIQGAHVGSTATALVGMTTAGLSNAQHHLKGVDVQNRINVEDGYPTPGSKSDPKYQTLPFNTKFNLTSAQNGQGNAAKIEALKQEKENDNAKFTAQLPPSPPLADSSSHSQHHLEHRGAAPISETRSAQTAAFTYAGGNDKKPISSVAPSVSSIAPSNLNPTLDSFSPPGGNSNQLTPINSSTPIIANNDSKSNKPALPPKPPVGLTQKDALPCMSAPPPYVPAPPPQSCSVTNEADTSITILRGGLAPPTSANLSVSSFPHPAEEGTSVDDDASSAGGEATKDENGLTLRQAVPNVHISINRRIEMPPAFHFPEDQTPPSDLLGQSELESRGGVLLPRDVTDNFTLYPMMNQIYKEFDHLTTEEQKQISCMLAAAVESKERAERAAAVEDVEDFDDSCATPSVVPDVYESEENRKKPKPKSIIRKKGQAEEGTTSHDRRVMFDPLALLLDASLEGELDLVVKTASQVQDPSAANDEGITALHNAICAGHLKIVKFLVEFGCDVNAQDSDGWTPLHCAASCNNLPMVRFLVEHGACIFATTLSDHETAAEKCEEDEEGYDGCSEYLYSVQEKLGTTNNGEVFAVYAYESTEMEDELSFQSGSKMIVMRKGDEVEREWWWARTGDRDGYIPRNFLGLYPRVPKRTSVAPATKIAEVPRESNGGLPDNERAAHFSEPTMEEGDDEAASSS